MSGVTRRPAPRRDRVLAPSPRVGQGSRVRPGENWKNLAEHVKARRVELGMRTTRQLATAVGITEKTIGRLEAGHSVRAGTLAAVERALDWLPGSMLDLLNGGEPRVATQRAGTPAEADTGTGGTTWGDTLDPVIRAELLGKTYEELLRMRAYWAAEAGDALADRWLAHVMEMREDEAARRTRDAG